MQNDAEETKEHPKEFPNFKRGTDAYQNKKSDTAKQGNSKMFYSSSFKLE
jgi:hypothetical protein